MLKNLEDWNDDRPIGGALAIAIHTAYHLGEICQAMCVVKQVKLTRAWNKIQALSFVGRVRS